MINKDILKKTINLPPPWEVDDIIFDETEKVFIIKVIYDKDLLLEELKNKTGADISIYDHTVRRWRYLDIWEYKSYIEAKVPRIKNKESGKIEQIDVPWSDNFSRNTHFFEKVIIDALVKMSIKDVQKTYSVSWYCVETILDKYIKRFRSETSYKINYMGIDELSRKKGHKYFTLVYDIEKSSVVWINKDRTYESLKEFVNWYGEKKLKKVKGIAMDMWDPYIKVLKEYKINKKIVFDKFHVTKHINEALDKIRRTESLQLYGEKIYLLKKTRYLWLSNPENISKENDLTLKELLKYNLKTVKGYELKLLFKYFWDYKTTKHAVNFFKSWFWRATHSRLEPMIKVAHTLKKYFYGILNYVQNNITNNLAEGINNKIRVYTKRAYGFKTEKMMMNMIYLTCGGLR